MKYSKIIEFRMFRFKMNQIELRERESITYCAKKVVRNCGVVTSGRNGGLRTWAAAWYQQVCL